MEFDRGKDAQSFLAPSKDNNELKRPLTLGKISTHVSSTS